MLALCLVGVVTAVQRAWDVLLKPETFGAFLWIGWVVTLGCAELWIRHTRPAPRPRTVFVAPILEEKNAP